MASDSANFPRSSGALPRRLDDARHLGVIDRLVRHQLIRASGPIRPAWRNGVHLDSRLSASVLVLAVPFLPLGYRGSGRDFSPRAHRYRGWSGFQPICFLEVPACAPPHYADANERPLRSMCGVMYWLGAASVGIWTQALADSLQSIGSGPARLLARELGFLSSVRFRPDRPVCRPPMECGDARVKVRWGCSGPPLVQRSTDSQRVRALT